MAYRKIEGRQELIGLDECARRLNLSNVQVSNLRKKGAPSVKGKFPWPDVLYWYIERRVSSELEKRAPSRSREDVKGAQAAIDLRRAELGLAREEATLVTVDYLEQQVARLCERLAATCRAIPGKWAPQVVGLRTIAEGQTRLEEITRELLGALTETGEDESLDAEDADERERPERVAKAPRRRRARRPRPAH